LWLGLTRAGPDKRQADRDKGQSGHVKGHAGREKGQACHDKAGRDTGRQAVTRDKVRTSRGMTVLCRMVHRACASGRYEIAAQEPHSAAARDGARGTHSRDGMAALHAVMGAVCSAAGTTQLPYCTRPVHHSLCSKATPPKGGMHWVPHHCSAP